MTAESTPRVFRILLPVRDLDAARRFYERLLGTRGRTVAPGRVYFDCGAVILGVLDVSSEPRGAHGASTEALYLATRSIDRVHERAKRLRCLSTELLHGDRSSPLGEVLRRPWGERSFYVEDPWGNPLCFVAEGTRFTGSPRRRASVRRGS